MGPGRLKCCLLLALMCALIWSSEAFWVVPAKVSEAPFVVRSPRMPFSSALAVSYPFSASLFNPDIQIPTQNLTDQVLLCHSQLVVQKGFVELVKSSRLRALVIVSHTTAPAPGLGAYYSDYATYLTNVSFPVFEVTQEDAEGLKKIWRRSAVDGGLLVTFVGDEPNPWAEIHASALPVVRLVLLLCAGLIGLAIFSKILVFERGKSILQICPSQIVLWCVFGGICLHIISLIDDAFGFKHTHVTVRPTAPFPFLLGALLQLALHCHSIVSHSSTSTVNVAADKLVVPFILLTVAMVFLEGFHSPFVGNFAYSGISAAQGVVYPTVMVIALVLHGYAVARAWKAKNEDNLALKMIRYSTSAIICLLVVICLAIVAWTGALLGLVFGSFSNSAEGFIGQWLILLFSGDLLAVLQLFIVSGQHTNWNARALGVLWRPKEPSLALSTSASQAATVSHTAAPKRSKGHKRISSAKRVALPDSPLEST